ncbi:MAG TPA: M14 family zinc carboxypeptidase [Armatimonadota bacterium]|nr:M14 family zinc carboxypeptidase [Armatimonadota bacterium]
MRKQRVVCAVAILAVTLGMSAASADKARLTSHAEMMSRLATLETVSFLSGSHRIKVVCIGRSVKGKDIPMVAVSDPNVPIELTKRLFIICRQHGDEPASTEAMLNLIEDLAFAADERTADLMSKVSFFVVPMVNPDGAGRYQRRNANKADLNRDWLTLGQPETRCVRAAIDAIAPDVLIDQHELGPGANRTDFVETAGTASGASADVVSECLELQRLVIGMLRTHDMGVVSYQTGENHLPRLAHRYFPIHGNTTTLLFETRQSGMREYQLQYRMRLHIVGTMTVAKYLAGQGDELRQRIAQHDSWRKRVLLASRKKAPRQAKGSAARRKR